MSYKGPRGHRKTEVLTFFIDKEVHSPDQVAKHFGMDRGNASMVCRRLMLSGKLERVVKGAYRLAPGVYVPDLGKMPQQGHKEDMRCAFRPRDCEGDLAEKVTDDEWCDGCGFYVCPGCDKYLPMGKHDVMAHKDGF